LKIEYTPVAHRQSAIARTEHGSGGSISGNETSARRNGSMNWFCLGFGSFWPFRTDDSPLFWDFSAKIAGENKKNASERTEPNARQL
jgi:hypothetical protein